MAAAGAGAVVVLVALAVGISQATAAPACASVIMPGTGTGTAAVAAAGAQTSGEATHYELASGGMGNCSYPSPPAGQLNARSRRRSTAARLRAAATSR